VHVAAEKTQVFSVPDSRSSNSGCGFCRSEESVFPPSTQRNVLDAFTGICIRFWNVDRRDWGAIVLTLFGWMVVRLV